MAFHEFKKTLNQNEFIEVYYEHLVRNPENELTKIFHFLGEDTFRISGYLPETDRKRHYIHSDLHMRSLMEPISDKKVSAFKKTFNKREIEIFESIAGDALKLCGYPLVTTGTAIVKLHEKIVFFVMDNFYRYLRKYFRLSSINKVWKLFRGELQFQIRSFMRSIKISR